MRVGNSRQASGECSTAAEPRGERYTSGYWTRQHPLSIHRSRAMGKPGVDVRSPHLMLCIQCASVSIVARHEYFEVWVRSGEKWELMASFREFEVAQAVAHGRHTGVRLVHAVSEEGKPVQRDTLAEIGGGAVREKHDEP